MEKAAVVEEVLARMAEGETVNDAVKAMKVKVSPGTVRRWINEREDWLAGYQRAKKLLAAALAEEAISIARESTPSSTAMDRVLIDTLKWAAAKANPAEYGERQTVEHQGAQTLQVKVVEEEAPERRTALTKGAVQALESAAMLTLSAPIAITSAQYDQ